MPDGSELGLVLMYSKITVYKVCDLTRRPATTVITLFGHVDGSTVA